MLFLLPTLLQDSFLARVAFQVLLESGELGSLILSTTLVHHAVIVRRRAVVELFTLLVDDVGLVLGDLSVVSHKVATHVMHCLVCLFVTVFTHL